MEIRYSKQAIKFLEKQEKSVRIRIKYAIMKLPSGDVKKLIGQPYYRLRVGELRVLFKRDAQIIYISKIDSRGQIYK